MSTQHKSENKHLETLISTAMKKVGAKKENDICRYLPVSKGGYIHHFSMRKMKSEDPEQLNSLISKYIINTSTPSKVAPKARAPRGSRKRRDHLPLTKQDIDRLLSLARQSGEKDIIRKLTPRKDLRSIKRELIASIKHNEVQEELWHTYVEIINSQSQLNGNQPATAANFTVATSA